VWGAKAPKVLPMTVYDRIRKIAKESKERSEGIFFKALAEDGAKVTIAFVGDPLDTASEFKRGEETKKATRILQNVVSLGDDGKIGKPLVSTQSALNFYEPLFTVADDTPGGVEGNWWRVRRSGGKGDTKTHYNFERVREIAAPEREAIKALTLHDLTRYIKGDGAPWEGKK
jgi:hypothetical protein